MNSGLDVAYIAGGLYLHEKAKSSSQNHDKYKGYGQSIMVQGGALLVFDAVMYAMHIQHGKAMYKLIEKIQPAENGLGVVLSF